MQMSLRTKGLLIVSNDEEGISVVLSKFSELTNLIKRYETLIKKASEVTEWVKCANF